MSGDTDRAVEAGLRNIAERHLDHRYPPPGHPGYRDPDLGAAEWRDAYFVLASIALEKLDECRAAFASSRPAAPDSPSWSAASRAIIEDAAAAGVTPDGEPLPDETRARGLLRIIQGNARYTDAETRNVRAIVGFMHGLSDSPDDTGLDVERLAEAHWLLVNEVNRTDETYLDLLDWIEPLVPHDAAERADAALSRTPHQDQG